ncbi:UNVERIFIED_CONTAM: hypothetical protein HDU68_010708 [Siphonaria sp. JEL0065]|nr:hypothetical protein HDU68_010708 [Siphonaria sp. JEL0065]
MYSKIFHEETKVAVVVSILQLVLLALLITREITGRVERTTAAATIKVILSPVNCFLVLTIITNCLTMVFIEVGKYTTDPIVYQATFVSSYVTYYAYQFLVVFYTLNRGLPVVQAVVPSMRRFFVAIAVLVFLMMSALIILSFFLVLGTDLCITSTLQIVCEIIMFLFDLAVLTCYAMYIHFIKTQGFELDMERLSILSWYGIASFIVFQLFLGSTSALAQLYVIPSVVMSSATLGLWIALVHLQNLTPLVYPFVQLGMKLSLQNDRRRRIAFKVNSVENAKNVSNQTSAKPSSGFSGGQSAGMSTAVQSY